MTSVILSLVRVFFVLEGFFQPFTMVSMKILIYCQFTEAGGFFWRRLLGLNIHKLNANMKGVTTVGLVYQKYMLMNGILGSQTKQRLEKGHMMNNLIITDPWCHLSKEPWFQWEMVFRKHNLRHQGCSLLLNWLLFLGLSLLFQQQVVCIFKLYLIH